MGEKVLLTVQELLKATNGYMYDDSITCNGFTSVATDSRNVCTGSLFIPLIGENQDGHNYVESACNNGASIIMVQDTSTTQFESVYKKIAKTVTIIIVTNTLKALQDAAKYYVSTFPSLKKIAVTGSNGKTTAKECIGSVLSEKYNVIMNVGNLNSETGLPLSMFTITKDHEIGLFEMGMNRRGEIKELSDVFFPDIALITNIGTAHIGILGTKDAIAEEKKQIFANFISDSVGFIFEDDTYVDFLKEGVQGCLTTYGRKSTNGISNILSNGIHGTIIQYHDTEIHFPLIGEHNANNALAAICIAQYLGLNETEIKDGLEKVKPLFGRSQILQGKPTIIQDCYNGSFESMNASLDFFLNLEWNGKKIAILGDMLELGTKSYEIHSKILERVMQSSIECIFLIGESFSNSYTSITNKDSKKVFYTDKFDDDSITAICNNIKTSIDSADLVLCKGSRGIKLERVVSIIQDKFKTMEAV